MKFKSKNEEIHKETKFPSLTKLNNELISSTKINSTSIKKLANHSIQLNALSAGSFLQSHLNKIDLSVNFYKEIPIAIKKKIKSNKQTQNQFTQLSQFRHKVNTHFI